jgi:hypothetical protein
MTISKEPSAALIEVVGATGLQGGSVLDNPEASDKLYRMRGLRQDVSKLSAPALAKRGVEVVSCNISVGNEAQVQKAFEGASFVFVRASKRCRITENVTNEGDHRL